MEDSTMSWEDAIIVVLLGLLTLLALVILLLLIWHYPAIGALLGLLAGAVVAVKRLDAKLERDKCLEAERQEQRFQERLKIELCKARFKEER